MSLTARERRLLRLAVALVLADEDALRALRREAPPGEPDRGWREIALQAHLFCGIPRTLAGLSVLAEVGGLGTPDADELETDAPDDAAGAALFERIYGSGAESVRGALEALHPTLARWIADHAYARVLARPGLEPRVRELAAVVSLAATEHERQLAGHARGAVACGAGEGELRESLEAVAELIGEERRGRAERVVERMIG